MLFFSPPKAIYVSFFPLLLASPRYLFNRNWVIHFVAPPSSLSVVFFSARFSSLPMCRRSPLIFYTDNNTPSHRQSARLRRTLFQSLLLFELPPSSNFRVTPFHQILFPAQNPLPPPRGPKNFPFENIPPRWNDFGLRYVFPSLPLFIYDAATPARAGSLTSRLHITKRAQWISPHPSRKILRKPSVQNARRTCPPHFHRPSRFFSVFPQKVEFSPLLRPLSMRKKIL